MKFNVLNAQTQYRVKFTTLNQYLTIFNNTSNPSGPVGGVGVDVYQESNAQKFTIETGANGGVYLKSADGYYIYCNGGSGGWNVDAINISDKSELYGFDMTGGSFKIYDDNGYIKVQEVNSAYYIFHNASYAEGASWQLEEVTTGGGDSGDGGDIEVPENLLTVEVGEGSTEAVGNAYYDTQPFSTYYDYTISQQIYTAEELGNIGTASLYSVAFKFQTNNNNGLTRNLEVYLKNVSKETFTSTSDWVSLTSDDKVYNGTIEIGAQNSWLTMNFSKPFDYEGGNVLVCVYDKTGSYSNASSRFYGYSTNADRCLNLPRDNNPFDVSNVGVAGYSWQKNNQIRFTYEASTDPIVKVNIEELDFGTVRAGGDFWTEKEIPSFDVEVTAKNTTIKSVSIDDDFFTSDKDLATAAGQTEFNFTVSYNKAAEAGDKSGKIVVTYLNGEEEATVEIPMTATAYVPAQGDVVENPKAITFTEGAYTDNVTGVYDDYILPGEENDGNNGDAVYTFTLTEESLISANVEGTNGLVAIYRAADLEGNGPSSENSFAGNENNVPEVSMTPTTFFNGFETGDFTGWQNIDGDGDGNVWEIATGGYASSAYKAVSHSYTSTDLYPENYLITDQKYLITENSILTVCATSHNGSYLDGYKVMVSETGEMGTFVEVEAITAGTVNNLIPYETDLSAYAGKEVYIAINHYTNAKWSLYIDNVELTDGSAKTRSLAQTRSTSSQIENVYPAGTYYLVAAAEGDFPLNISTGDIPAPEATTYVSPENNATEVTDATLVFQLGKYTDEYQVLVGTSADALETVVDWTSELATTYTLADAANNTKYYWQVNTRNAKDVVTTGVVWSFVTPLDVPQNVTATATELYQDNNTTTISWTEIEGLTYNVYVDGVKQNEEAVTATEYVLSDLAWSPEGHSVTVTAIHGELGESPMSEAVVVKVAGTFTITVNAVEDATVALSYSEGATDEFGNQLEDVYTNVTTDVNGQAVFENVKLLGDWSAHYYEINVTKGLYNEEVYVINNVTIAHDENYEVDVEMTLTTPNFNVSSEAIHVGESVTLTWDAIEAENVTYNVYVNGTKHNAEAITAVEYVISDLAYNMNPGNAVAVTAVHSLGETPQDPIYVKVAGTFTLTVNVTDGTKPIEGATVNVTTDEWTYDEFGNKIASLGSLLTDENGKAVFNNVKLLNPNTYCAYSISATKDVYGTHSTTPLTNYGGVANGDNVTREIVMTLPEPQNVTAGKELYIAGEDVVLAWETPEFNTRAFLGYNVYSVIDGDYDLGTETSYTKLNEETLTETTYTIEDVKYDAKFAVSAVYNEGESSKVNANVQITTYANLVVNVKDANTSAGIDGAVVEIYSDRTGETETFVTANGGIVEKEYLLGNYTVTVKKNDSHYEVEPQEVQLVYGDGAELEFALTPKASIENVTVTADNNGNVSWTGDYTKWNVYRRNVEAPQELIPVATELEATSTTDAAWETLEPGTYQYGVAALVEPQAQTRGTEVIFEEGFENNGTNIPTGWSSWKSSGASSSTIDWTPATGLIYGSYNSYEGTYSAFSNGASGGGYAYIQTIDIELSGEASMNFYYIAPSWVGDINSLIIKVIPQDTYEEYEVFNTNKISYSVWTPGYVDLSGYQGKTIKIQFICENGYGYGVGIDDIVITGEVTSEVETQIVWSNEVVKQGPATFIGGDTENPTAWNVNTNWSTGSVPAAGADVIINADAVISSEVNVASITINNGDSYPYNTLTVADKGILTVTGTISQQSDYLLVLEEGGQIFQNNNNVTARFRMSIDNPTMSIDNPEDWSASKKDGWQFISMPMADVTYDWFTGADDEYDLYKYDGSQDLEWLNHKAGSFAETEFISGKGYLASLKEAETATVYGTLNTSTYFSSYFAYNADKDLANFRLIGNPFTYDIKWGDMNPHQLADGFAIVNKDGIYEYYSGADAVIKVGQGFFIKAIAGESSYSQYIYSKQRSTRESNNSLNITATGNAGKDNVIINLAGKSEGFNKLQNFNDAIATVYVQDNGANYGIYNCDADVQEVELNFNANQMGNYTISIEPNGKFQTVTLVDRFTGIETNMLLEDYSFTAMSNENNNRFIVKLAVSDQQSAVSDNFVYQSGEDLIIDAEGTVQIIDVMGRVLLSDEVESTNNRINVSGFRNGTYMVRVINGSEVKVEKVVIY